MIFSRYHDPPPPHDRPPTVTPSTLESVRAATTRVRPGHDHGCPGVEILPGLWTAHFHDIEGGLDALRAVSPDVTVIVNVGTDKCHRVDYGPDVRVVCIDLLDDPDEMKRADALPDDHPDKAAIKADVLRRVSGGELLPCGDAKKDFGTVNAIIDETISSEEGAVLIHGLAGISRSPAFILAYMMKTRRMTLVEAIEYFKQRWDACWPADTFVMQLIEYEKELGLSSTTNGGGEKEKTNEDVADNNRCAVCNMPATKRCQRCKSAYYCCREHQVSHWRSQHKSTCNVIPADVAVATSQALHKMEFDRIRLTYGLDHPDRAEIIAEILSREDGVSALNFAKMFGMTTPEAIAFLEWIRVGVQFKEDVLDSINSKRT